MYRVSVTQQNYASYPPYKKHSINSAKSTNYTKNAPPPQLYDSMLKIQLGFNSLLYYKPSYNLLYGSVKGVFSPGSRVSVDFEFQPGNRIKLQITTWVIIYSTDLGKTFQTRLCDSRHFSMIENNWTIRSQKII